MDKGEGYADELKSKFDDFSDSLTEKYERKKRDLEGFAEKGKAKYGDAKKDVKNATDVNYQS